MEILAEQIADRLAFYESLSADVLQGSFRSEYGMMLAAKDGLERAARNAGDEEFISRLESLLGPFEVEPTENALPPIE